MYRMILVLFLALSMAPINTWACDVDNDGIDDPTTYDSSTFTWRSKLSTDNSTREVVYGEVGAFPMPGNFLGDSMSSYYSYVAPNFFWKIYIDSMDQDEDLNFGRTDASYLGSHDYNGDGIADAAKVINRCNKVRASCHSNRARFNILYNEVSATDAFSDISPLVSGFFGKGLSPLFVMDANNDGSEDICFAKTKRNNRRRFRAYCKDVATMSIIEKFNIGKLYNRPLSATVSGADLAVIWRTVRRTASTKITLIDVNGNKTSVTLPTDGTVIIGDWLGTGSDQVGVATGGVLTVYNPLNQATSSMLIPTGDPVDCNNNIYGRAADKIITTRNACKVFDCN